MERGERELKRREKWSLAHPTKQWHEDRGEVIRRAAADLFRDGNVNLAISLMELWPKYFHPRQYFDL